MDVKCQDIHYSIGEKKILNGVSLEVEGGQFQTILGPNGSGKSTLLKTIYRQLKPDSGQILLDGKSLDQVSLKETAKEMAVVIVRWKKLSCLAERPIFPFYKKNRSGTTCSSRMP